jgi:hypothetical protein
MKCVVAGVIAMFFIAAQPAIGQEPGQVGGPPTLGAPLDKRGGPTSEAIVIGAGIGPIGRIEVVAQNSKNGLCVFIDHPDRGGSEGTCGAFTLPTSIAVSQESFVGARRRRNALSTYSGFIQPTVSSTIGVNSQRKKKGIRRKTAAGVTAVPASDILSRLHQDSPFAFFTVEFRGCLIDAKVRVRAFDASGTLLGTDQAFRPHFPTRIGGMRFTPCAPGSSAGVVRFGSVRVAAAG